MPEYQGTPPQEKLTKEQMSKIISRVEAIPVPQPAEPQQIVEEVRQMEGVQPTAAPVTKETIARILPRMRPSYWETLKRAMGFRRGLPADLEADLRAKREAKKVG